MPDDWDQHEEPPILVNAGYFRTLPANNAYDAQHLRSFATAFAERAEKHIEHLEKLLELKGITCVCSTTRASPQCMIHVHDNLPED